MVPRLPLRKSYEYSGCLEFVTVLWMLDSFFPQCCPTSAKRLCPQTSLNFSLYMPFLAWEDYHRFYLAFALEDAYTKLRTRKQQITQ
jgi:hypothetical protein